MPRDLTARNDEIWRRRREGREKVSDLAAEFGLSRGYVYTIIGRIKRHLRALAQAEYARRLEADAARRAAVLDRNMAGESIAELAAAFEVEEHVILAIVVAHRNAEVCRLFRAGEPQAELAARFSLSEEIIDSIIYDGTRFWDPARAAAHLRGEKPPPSRPPWATAQAEKYNPTGCD